MRLVADGVMFPTSLYSGSKYRGTAAPDNRNERQVCCILERVSNLGNEGTVMVQGYEA